MRIQSHQLICMQLKLWYRCLWFDFFIFFKWGRRKWKLGVEQEGYSKREKGKIDTTTCPTCRDYTAFWKSSLPIPSLSRGWSSELVRFGGHKSGLKERGCWLGSAFCQTVNSKFSWTFFLFNFFPLNLTFTHTPTHKHTHIHSKLGNFSTTSFYSETLPEEPCLTLNLAFPPSFPSLFIQNSQGVPTLQGSPRAQ